MFGKRLFAGAAALLLIAGTALATTDGAFIEEDGLIVIEVESAAMGDGWVKETSLAGYTGSGYYRWTKGSTGQPTGPGGIMTYKLLVTNPGRYKFDIRCSKKDVGDSTLANDCFTKMVGHALPQGEMQKVWMGGANYTFVWGCKFDLGHGNHPGCTYDLVAGVNEFQVAGRSKDFMIDRMAFWRSDLTSASVAQDVSTPESARVGDPVGPVSGELKQWHKVSVSFNGPETSETATPNPFLDYRMDVTFTQEGQSYVVPGYYCADGDAADSSSTSGSVWRAHFSPPTTGTWNYAASFRTGTGVAVSNSATAGTATGFDGESGSFDVAASDKTGDDFRGKGLLELMPGKPYMRFAGTGDIWIKGGTDSPEDLLGYSDFDNTAKLGSFGLTDYPNHKADWVTGDPTWGSDKGKGIIGVLNYLNSQEVNSVYFLPMNLGGDGNNTHPFASTSSDLVYDCSKLDQWGIVFDHAQKMGVVLQIVLNEAEASNKTRLDNGALGTERRLFYRELIARFGHINGVKWNICEEYNHSSSLPWSPDLVKSFAAFIRNTDPYDHPIGVHNMNTDNAFEPFSGDSNFDYFSIQLHPAHPATPIRYLDYLDQLRDHTSNAGRPLALMFDEVDWATPADDESHDLSNKAQCKSGAKFLRKAVLWQCYLGGAGGVEWILSDLLNSHDFRRYEALWGYTRHARRFMEQLPLGDMVPSHQLLTGESQYTVPYYDIEGVVLAKPGDVYAVQLPNATQSGTLDLSGASGSFIKRWYNPRSGMFEGTSAPVTAGGSVPMGTPPSSVGDDWVVLIQKSGSSGNQAPTANAGADRTAALGQAGPPAGWHYAPWTGDTNSGVSASSIYTATHCFGDNHGGPVTVNGVVFTENFNTSGTGWSIGGAKMDWSANDDANLSGSSEDLGEEFIYDGKPRTVTFTGLTTGQQYEVTFFSVGWDDGLREQTFETAGVDSSVIDQTVYGNNQGIRISCGYLATATSREFTMTPRNQGNTFHLYAMANRELATTTIELNGAANDPDEDALTVAWSVISGPGGVAFGDASAVETTISFGTPGTYVLRLTVGDGEFTTSDDLTVTVITDSDGDGVDDDWEQHHFDDLTTVTGTSDYDGDGSSDRHEWLAHTDPKNPDSLFAITALTRTSAGDSWSLEWKGSSEGTYGVYMADTPDGTWHPHTNGITGAALSTVEVSVPSDARFFCVVQE
jgi:hypothetical protein